MTPGVTGKLFSNSIFWELIKGRVRAARPSFIDQAKEATTVIIDACFGVLR
jgi:hypothetical protein